MRPILTSAERPNASRSDIEGLARLRLEAVASMHEETGPSELWIFFAGEGFTMPDFAELFGPETEAFPDKGQVRQFLLAARRELAKLSRR